MATEWNPKTRTYIRDGKPISQERLREFILQTVENAKGRLKSIGESYLEHRNTAEWVIAHRTEMANMHSALAMIAQGGKSQMTQSEWGKVGQIIRVENDYLRQFEIDLAKGNVSDAQLLARAAQYASAGYKTYQNMVTAREKAAGIGYAKRVLAGGADHCDDCLEAADEGFVPINELREIGDSQCSSGCLCDVEYADAA